MKGRITVNRKFAIGEIDDRIYSGFLEQGGRAVYEGIYQPDHESADADGFRTDVLELVKKLNMPLVRYPGGNYVSVYDWKDGIGPKEKRPARLELAWQGLETNEFGVDEFMRWCRKAGVKPMMAVNLATQGPKEARELLEYCNFPGGTELSDLRRKYGSEEPYGVKVWCLGNEMDGPWQLGQRNPEDYARVAREAAKMMKCVDDDIELIVCGSSFDGIPSFGTWDETVLDWTFDRVDYLSIHQYYGNPQDMTPGYLARPEAMSRYIDKAVAVCDAVAAKKRSDKRIMISFDEWNVWFHSHGAKDVKPKWSKARNMLEDVYNAEDALLVGMLLMTLINHADRVKIACLAQTVNVIAPIMTAATGGAWKQTIFDPIALTSAFGRGRALRAIAESENYEAEFRTTEWEKPEVRSVPYLYCAAVENASAGETVVFACNRSLDETMDLEIELENYDPRGIAGAMTLFHPDLKAINEQGEERVKAVPLEGVRLNGRTVAAQLPPASGNMIRGKIS